MAAPPGHSGLEARRGQTWKGSRMAKKTAAHDPSRLKKTFLDSFRDCGNVTVAASAAGIDRRSHYRWLKEDDEYAGDYESAREEAADSLEAEARRRAVEGVEEPTGWYKGSPGGYVTRYSDTLLIFLLKGVRPEVYRERQDVRHTGHDGGAIEMVVTRKVVHANRITEQVASGNGARS